MRAFDLSAVVREGEGYLVEFKESLHNIDKEICAFANASGGTLYVGITDSGKIKKTSLTNSIKSQIQSTVRSLEPPPPIVITAVGDVIKIDVAESEYKPVKAGGGFYLRIGSNSQKLTRDEIFSFAVKENRIKFDQQLYVEAQGMELLSMRQVEIFRQRAKLDAELDNLELLVNLGCAVRQRQKLYLTYAGILLFGNDPQKIFPSATMTVLAMKDPATILEQKILKGTLFEQIEKAFVFLKDKLHARVKIESLVREEELEIPEYVLRELLVNAVIHRDYFESSCDVVVKVFPGTIEFTNPGLVSDKISLDKIYGKSFRRNPLLADIFFRAGFIERAGTGLLRVREALKKLRLRELKIAQEGPFFIATLPRHGHQVAVNERQKVVFAMPSDFFPFSSADYAKHFKITDRMARLDIQELIVSGVLKKLRDKRRIRYNKV